MDQVAQRPAGVPHRTPPSLTGIQLERGVTMGRKKGKGIGFPAGMKTWLASPLEWEIDRGGRVLWSGVKTPGISPESGRGS